jgi:hypothetical protein
MFAAVITTIQEPRRAVVKLIQTLADCGGLLVVAGDQKGRAHSRSRHFAEGCRIDFLSLTDQHASEFKLGRKLPVGSYSRKNCCLSSCDCRRGGFLYETDDENAPFGRFLFWARYAYVAR